MNLDDLLMRRAGVTVDEADRILRALAEIWNVQAPTMGAQRRDLDQWELLDNLGPDLASLHQWFNPIASGKRLRGLIEALRPAPASPDLDLGDLVEPIDERRVVVAPEGRVAIWLLAGALGAAQGASSPSLWLESTSIETAWCALASTYRRWNRQRLASVTALLHEETATLRPTAAGLLLVLLLNRNTSLDRRLPVPKNAATSEDISAALSGPVLAFANSFTGSDNANSRGLDLYRGWALGEISRRLGSAVHKDDDGLWVDQVAAEARLVEALSSRPPEQRRNLPAALEAALSEYQRVRPRLTSLGIAHERPSATAHLFARIAQASGLSDETAH